MHDQIGHYKIQREIGRGGMGVVYLGHDTRLDRPVAIKTLPEHLTNDPDRLIRFEREARTLASLNHSNVAGIYGVEEADGAKFLILEFVEGETLAERLDRGPLPVDDALEIAVQIAAGVEAAHEAGVIHRDLKPANIKITPDGEAKVLDFGLAKTTEAQTTSSTSIPTLTSPAIINSPTIPGAIMGTAPYMSPEQARGRSVDKRTDIWSFGVVLYEMLVGASPFHGETAADTIGAVLHKDIDLDLVPASTPRVALHVLTRCLERNKAIRYRDIGDVRIELERAQTEPQPVGGPGSRRVPIALLAISALVFGVVGASAVWFLRPKPTLVPMHVAVPVSDRFESVEIFALSPDGETLAIIAQERSVGDESVNDAVYVRAWSEPAFQKLADTERATGPLLFSPSGDQIMYQVEDEVRPTSEMRSMPLSGGPATRLYAIEQNGLLGDSVGYLSDEELVVLSQDGQELYSVSTSGGTPELIVRLVDPGDRYLLFFRRPHPDGRFMVASTWSPSTKSFALFRIDLETGESSLLLDDAIGSFFLPNGHLAFVRNNALWIAPFDSRDARVTGPARGGLSGISEITLDQYGERAVYLARGEIQERSEIVIVDVSGQVVETLLDAPGTINQASLSPDGRRLAYNTFTNAGEAGLWVLDITSGLTRPISPKGVFAFGPSWLPDGRLAYSSVGAADERVIMVMEAAPGAIPEPLLPRSGEGAVKQVFPAFSPDGRHMIVADFPVGGGEPGEYLFDVGDGDSGRAFYASSMIEGGSTFRPDGAWVAYHTNGTGRFEIYLRPFVAENPESAPIYPVTRSGGAGPMWSTDGRTLYFEGVEKDDGKLFAVTIETEPELTISEPRTVFTDMKGVNDIVVMPDGRFIRVQSSVGMADRRPDMRLILNWGLAELADKRQ